MTAAGDRLLSKLVPNVDASACCPADCYCRNRRYYCIRCDCTSFYVKGC